MDRITNSLINKRFVFWEEVARDGAQAKTILSGKQRAEIARMHGEMFNEHGPDHLVFAAGFVAIGKEEVDAIKTVADNVDNCCIAANCRSVKEEIDISIDAVRNAKFPRIAYVFPASERMCRLMLHKTQKEALEQGIEIAKYALDKAGGIPVDVQMAGGFDADPIFIAQAAAALRSEGISICHIGDTRGRIYPKETAAFIDTLLAYSDRNQIFGTHFHDDMGFSLINNLASIHRGLTLSATSWLGLAERNGIARTELLTVHMAYQPEKLFERLQIPGENLFLSPPNLKMIPKIAQKVSEFTGVSLKVTDPMVGTGVNSISTGTPFVDTVSFQPFDTEEVLGIPQKIYVTQLAKE
jgi:isopropylmalate/homocitrate/citramalate synthase